MVTVDGEVELVVTPTTARERADAIVTVVVSWLLVLLTMIDVM